ncbi:hypothetical protein PDL73_20695 [Bacteroides fragilis]|nr:hypothetical protein [Bacteroides fragilis]MDA1474514.1 hypothetical protein [Bacteroides fragilis]
MDQLSFVESFRTSPFILTEGAIVERLRHEFQIPLDKHIVHAALIYNDSYRETLAEIYRQYSLSWATSRILSTSVVW